MKAEIHDPFAEGLLHRLPLSPRKVALLRASRIGDFVCAGPAFHAFRTALPKAQITIIALPMLRDIAMRSPDFDRFEAFPGFPGIAEQLFDARETAQFLRRMQAEHFVAGPFRALVHAVPCRPCTDPVCPIDHECLTGITVEEAVAAAQQVMAQSAPRSLSHSPSYAAREPVRPAVPLSAF